MKSKNRCRCTTYLVDGACPHGCPPPRQQVPRRRTAGVKERHETYHDMRREVDQAAKRIGVPSMAWGTINYKRAVEREKGSSCR